MSKRGGEARPATVKIIETVHVDADQCSFKSVVQKFTGKDAVVGGWTDGSERASTEAAAWRAEYLSKQAIKPAVDRK
jgi:hypothetical protein